MLNLSVNAHYDQTKDNQVKIHMFCVSCFLYAKVNFIMCDFETLLILVGKVFNTFKSI